MNVTQAYDLAVIGAGPAGAATAFHAARAGLRVALLDKSEFPRDKICGDGLTGRAVNELRLMGLEEAVRRRGARVSRFSLGAPVGHVDAALSEAGSPGYAYVLPRLQLDSLLVESAVTGGAQFLPGHEVRGWTCDDQGIELLAEHPSGSLRLRAPLAVLATGAHAGLALRSGVLKAKPRTMVAIRQYVAPLPGTQDTWHLHFSRATLPGYGWIFPAGNGIANVGIGLEHRRGGVPLAQLLTRYLDSAVARRILADARPLAAPRSFPLRCDFLDSPLTAPRLLIAGEAAGLVNPLTGEGIDYALESGRIAAEHALSRLQGGVHEDTARDAYAAALHDRYDALFAFSERLRTWCGSPWGVSTLAVGAMARPQLKSRLVGILLGDAPAPQRPNAARLFKALLRG